MAVQGHDKKNLKKVDNTKGGSYKAHAMTLHAINKKDGHDLKKVETKESNSLPTKEDLKDKPFGKP